MNGETHQTASIGTGAERREALRMADAPSGPVQAAYRKRTAVFARSRNEEGMARQVRDGRAYAVRVLGVDPDSVVVLTDRHGASGLDRCRRRGVGELISRMAEFDRIVVSDVDRLSRDRTTLARLRYLFAGTRCELQSTASGRVAADTISIAGCMITMMTGTRKRDSRIAASPRSREPRP